MLLDENQQINLSKKQFGKLSSQASNAITAWESSNWTGGELERAYKAKNEIYHEIYNAFTPIREYLKKTHGEKIKLYRGLGIGNGFDQEYVNKKVLESWTDDKKVAEYFAGWGRMNGRTFKTNLYRTITDDEIKKALDTYKRTGFTIFNGIKYNRTVEIEDFSGKMRRLANMYAKDNEYLTDTWEDELEKKFKEEQQEHIESNKEIFKRGELLTENIDIDRILWITNNLHSKEYIVAKTPLK